MNFIFTNLINWIYRIKLVFLKTLHIMRVLRNCFLSSKLKIKVENSFKKTKTFFLTFRIYTIFYLYIYFACLSVCPFVSNKRQNGGTDRAKILCGTSHDPREGLWMLEITKFVHKSFWFLFNFENALTFLLLFYIVQREDAHSKSHN